MKKIVIILVLFFLSFTLIGCVNNSQQAEMELIDVKVYDIGGNELIGKWDYRYGYEPLAVQPILYHYHVEGRLGESYKIEFYFKSNTNHTMSKFYFTFNDDSTNAIMCIPEYSEDQKMWVGTYVIETLTSDKLRLNMFRWWDENAGYNFTNSRHRTGLTFDVDSNQNVI